MAEFRARGTVAVLNGLADMVELWRIALESRGFVVVSAELDLYAGNPIENGQYEVHTMLLSWAENQATFEDRSSNTPWPAPGAGTGSFAPTPIATLVALTIGDYTVPLDAAAVQTWVSTPAANFGMRWSANSPEGRGGNFDASEGGTNARRPLLRVTFR